MYTERWLILFRILLSTLILLGLLWLALSGWPIIAHNNAPAGRSRDPRQTLQGLAPLFWQKEKETESPATCTAAIA